MIKVLIINQPMRGLVADVLFVDESYQLEDGTKIPVNDAIEIYNRPEIVEPVETLPEEEEEFPEEELPHGVHERIGGGFEARCRGCDRYTEIYLDDCELDQFDLHMHYCGGSPWCCP